ncbi:hypothetical protein GGS24DRAFT_505205 [Hypoxylon argillaceum]|nr:hypothetical protein GGS24DRAFT_505205 [Hypoxylon argillaceum]
MERLSQILIALALVAPALAAPGPVPPSLYQQPMNLKRAVPEMQVTPSLDVHPAAPASNPVMPPASSASSPLELRKDRPSENYCTPGDRYCHASLDEVLFCNDSRQWVRYALCQAGTFCHRLHMVCVSEIYAFSDADKATFTSPSASPSPSPSNSTSNSTSTSTSASTPHPHTPRDEEDDDPHRCKEGDRRCDTMFNRVDRCNSLHDWVTYHDCRKSETCDDVILECLPKIQTSNATLSAPNDTATALL